MLSVARFADLLDRHGAALENWPARSRISAEALVASSAQARALLARAAKLDALVTDFCRPDASDQQAARRILAGLAAPLPPQRPAFWSRLLPPALLEFDFAPAWPRFATLLAIAMLGFVVGLSDVGMVVTKGSPSAIIGRSPASDSDLSLLLFEPDPLSTVR